MPSERQLVAPGNAANMQTNRTRLSVLRIPGMKYVVRNTFHLCKWRAAMNESPFSVKARAVRLSASCLSR